MPRTYSSRSRAISISLGLAVLLLLSFSGFARAEIVTNSSEDLRTGWYPKESSITPELVTGGTFGEMWSTPVEGQVYAQPLLADGTLLVATEDDKVYGLNPTSGAEEWSQTLGTPWNAGDISCADLAPTIGITSTPVIDTATETAYLVHKTYVTGKSGAARWYMDALNIKNGQERAGFPVELAGKAQNASGQTFAPTKELQRPGLLMMEGVVYAAFGSDCDSTPYQGWVFGVSTGGAIKARWVADATGNGAGIWQSGAGLTSDGPGTLLVSTGNGGAPAANKPIAGSTPPENLGESIVRLRVQGDGSLKATDFFAPYDAEELDSWDADFASGGITGLPGEYFGTESIPDLAVAVGKDGYVYLLNRNNLGGFEQGPSGSDNVVQRLGPYGGVWSRPGVWPGEGGWVYIPTASGGKSSSGSSGNLMVYKYGESGTHTPQLSLAATSSEAFGFSSSAPIITSNGTTSKTALVWIVWSPNGSGVGAQLRAYQTQPVKGEPVMVFSAPVGTSAKFATPGVGPNKLYVGTRDGHVIAFGSPIAPALSGSASEFPTTTVGQSSEEQITLEADEEITVTEIKSSSSQFTVGGPTSPALPATLKLGQKITVPVTFSPEDTGPQGATLILTTSTGKTSSFALSGTGQASTALLETAPTVVSFGGVAVGQQATETAVIRNIGSEPMEIEGIELPEAPFEVQGLPAVGEQIGPGHSVTITVSFEPGTLGQFHDEIGLQTSGGDGAIDLTGIGSEPGELQINTESIDYGEAYVGAKLTRDFEITNTGGTAVEITTSKPPIGGYFAAKTSLSEGTTIQAGEKVTEEVEFSPQAAGHAEGVWQINGNDRTGPAGRHIVKFEGSAHWKLHIENESNQFKSVPVGGSETKSFTVTNTSEAPIEILESNAPSGAFAASTSLPVGTVMAPNESRVESVKFAPGNEGEAHGAWQIRSSDAPEALHEVSFEGDGIAPGDLRIVEETLNYEVNVRGTAERSFTITNVGEAPVEITKSNPPSGGSFTADTSLPVGTVIEGGDSVTESVSFAPSSAGQAEGAWEIEGDDISGRHIVKFEGTAYWLIGLEVSSERVQFGRVFLGDSATESFTVTNKSEAPIEILESTPPSGAFAASTSLPVGTVMAPGESRVESVKFAPSAEGETHGVWQIRSSDAPEVTHQVDFDGDGYAPFTGISEQGPKTSVPVTETKPAPTPTVSVVTASTKASAKWKTPVKLTCPKEESRCTGTITLRTASKVKVSGRRKAIVTLAKGSFSVAGGHSVTVQLSLTSAARTLLRAHRTLRAAATIVAHDLNGATHTTHKTLTLQAPKSGAAKS